MMRLATQFAIAVGVVALAGSCGPSSQNFCVDTARASCQLQYRCCTAVERQALFVGTNLAIGPYDDEGGCVDAFTRQCEASSQATDESIAAGRLAFDAAKAEECVQGRQEAVDDCDASAFVGINIDENCRDIVTGLVKDGDPCFDTGECAEPGSQCEGEPTINEDGSVTITLEGKCKGEGDVGEDCIDGNRCNGELRCLQNVVTGETSCETPRGPTQPCQSDFDCDDVLSCLQNAGGSLVCTAPAGQGEPCNQTADCDVGLECLAGPGGQNNICTVRGAAGSVCGTDDDCQSGLLCGFDVDINPSQNICTVSSGAGEQCASGELQCEPGLSCLNDNTTFLNTCFGGVAGDPCQTFGRRCAPGLICRSDLVQGRDECQPPVALNQPCNSFIDTPECSPELRCRPDASGADKCLAPVAPAAACNPVSFGEIDPCNDDNICQFNGTTNVCLARAGAGDSCSSDDQCELDLFCDNSTFTCIGRRIANQTCTDDRECSVGLECRQNETNSGEICRGLSSQGQGCAAADDCAAGLDCRTDDAGLRQICRGVSAENQRCDQQADCAPNLDCRAQDGTGIQVCRSISDEGEGCVNVLDCVAGLECRNDQLTGQLVCLGPGAVGDRCFDVSDCEDGLVCSLDPVDGVFECATLAVEGDACSADQDCIAGLRCRDINEVGEFRCTSLKDDFEQCADDSECISDFCNPNNETCGDVPAEIDFEVCDGI